MPQSLQDSKISVILQNTHVLNLNMSNKTALFSSTPSFSCRQLNVHSVHWKVDSFLQQQKSEEYLVELNLLRD